MKVDATNIKTVVQSNLSLGRNSLNAATTNLRNIKIPSDFEDSSIRKLINMVTDLSGVVMNINGGLSEVLQNFAGAEASNMRVGGLFDIR